MSLQMLPNEILVQIFSNLSHKDILKASAVCRKFYTISQDPSLWPRVLIWTNTKRQVAIFYETFMNKSVSCVRDLTWHHFPNSEHEANGSQKEANQLNCLFKKFRNLERLTIRNVDLSSIVFPSSLIHLEYFNFSAERVTNALLSIANCQNLQHLSINVSSTLYTSHQEQIDKLLEKYSASLTSLKIAVAWFPDIVSCQNLKHLSVCVRSCNLSSILRTISSLPNLEELDIENHKYDVINSSDFVGFVSLRRLYINSTSFNFRNNIVSVNLLPKLETFILNEYFSFGETGKLFLMFASNCQSLKNISYTFSKILFPSVVVGFLHKIAVLQSTKNYENICLCSLTVAECKIVLKKLSLKKCLRNQYLCSRPKKEDSMLRNKLYKFY